MLKIFQCVIFSKNWYPGSMLTVMIFLLMQFFLCKCISNFTHYKEKIIIICQQTVKLLIF